MTARTVRRALGAVALMWLTGWGGAHAQTGPTPEMPNGLPAGPTVLSPQALPAPLAAAWRNSRLPDSALSLVVQPVDGPALFLIGAQVPRNPASVMKLVTTWAALSELGPNYSWRTDFLTEPGTRIDAQGALSGPLYLRASGDPQLMFEDMWRLLRELRLHGVKQIGDLIVDRSLFGNVAVDPGAFDGASDRPYNASPDAWMVGFGAMRVAFLPDPVGRRWLPVIDPPVQGVRLEGAVSWTENVCPGSPAVGIEPLITSQGITLRLSGSAAGSCGEFSVYRLALSQTDLAEAIFRLLWKEVGGTFKGSVRAGTTPPASVLLTSHESPTLLEVIRVINKQSNNVMARAVLLTLGAERGRRPATVQSSGEVVYQRLSAQGLAMPELVLDNGAGLSRNGRISAQSMAAMLATAWRSPLMPEFVSSFAIAGVDGTVRRRMRDVATQGMAHLKTGTLRDTRALAGYVLGASGRRYLIVSFVNDDRAEAVRDFNDALITWIAEQ